MHDSESLTVSRPAIKNEEADVEDVVLGQPFAIDLRGQEPRDDVVSGALGALVDERAEVVVDLESRPHHDVVAVLTFELVAVEDAVAQAQEHAQLLLGQTHQAEEHRRREDLGEFLGEVALAAVDESVDEPVDPTRDVGLLLVHATRCEEGVEDLAVLRVVRRVDVERDQAADVAETQVDLGREQLVMPEHELGDASLEAQCQVACVHKADGLGHLLVARLRRRHVEPRAAAHHHPEVEPALFAHAGERMPGTA